MTAPRTSLADAVTPRTTKGAFWLHTAMVMVVTGGLYAGVNALPMPEGLKIPLLGLLSGVIIRRAGTIIAALDTES